MSQLDVLNPAAFLQAGNRLLASLRAHRRSLTMVLVDADELREVEAREGVTVARALRHVLATHLLAITGEFGLTGRTGKYEYTLLLPVVDEELAWRMIERELGDEPVVRVRLATRNGRQLRAEFRPTCMLRATAPSDRDLGACHAALREELEELKWLATGSAFGDSVALELGLQEEALSPSERALRLAMPDGKGPERRGQPGYI